jgi:hypothetical protein
MKAKTTKNAGKSLVVLGVKRSPYIYNDTVHMSVVEGDPATLVRQLRKTTQRNVRVYAQAPVKSTKLVNRFLRHTRSAKGGSVGGAFYRAEYTDISTAIMFMRGECALGVKHRLAYLYDALAPTSMLTAGPVQD